MVQEKGKVNQFKGGSFSPEDERTLQGSDSMSEYLPVITGKRAEDQGKGGLLRK